MHDREADPCTEVEQASHHPGIDDAEQQLGQGRAGAEKESGEEGEGDAGAVHGGPISLPWSG